jgi:hypothetical protein
MKNNRLKQLVLAIGMACLLPQFGDVDARGSGHSSHSTYSSHSYSHHSSTGSSKSYTPKSQSTLKTTKAAPGLSRDAHGKIARSSSAKAEFKHSHPCPSTGKRSGTCPGYVIDHVSPLKRGGADQPSNMQWQTVQAAKEKDRWE